MSTEHFRLVLLLVLSQAASVQSQTWNEINARDYTKLNTVTTLLDQMSKSLVATGKRDEVVHQRQTCWCSKTKEEVDATQDAVMSAQELADAASAALQDEISAFEFEIADYTDQIKDRGQDLQDAITERGEANKEFTDETSEITAALSDLNAAVALLESFTATALLQKPALLQNIQKSMKRAKGLSREHVLALHKITSPSSVEAAFYEGATPSIAPAPRPEKTYSYDATIVGAIQTLIASEQVEFTKLTAAENEEVKVFTALKVAMQAQISSLQSSLRTAAVSKAAKQAELTALDVKKEVAKVSKEDAVIYKKYVTDLCDGMDAQFAYRRTMRNKEIVALDKAIEIFAAYTTQKTLGVAEYGSFLQVSDSRSRQLQASRLLEKIGENEKVQKIAKILKSSNANSELSKVVSDIETMIDDLKMEMVNEAKHVQFCKDEMAANELQHKMKTNEQNDMEEQVKAYSKRVQLATEAQTSIETTIAEMQAELTTLAEERTEGKGAYEKSVEELNSAIDVTQRGLSILEDFYSVDHAFEYPGTAGNASHASKFNPSKIMPGELTTPKFAEGATQAIAAVRKILGYFESELTSVMATERMAIESYNFITTNITNTKGGLESETSTDNKFFKISYQASYIATSPSPAPSLSVSSPIMGTLPAAKDEVTSASTSLADAQEAVSDIGIELDQISSYAADLQASCKWYIDNFDARQAAMKKEIWALDQAVSLLTKEGYAEKMTSSPATNIYNGAGL